MLPEVNKQNLKSIGGRIGMLGREIEELDPYSEEFFTKTNNLLNSIEKMVIIARDVLKKGGKS